MKDPILAGVLSFLVPGLGQIYIGKTSRGIMWFIGFVLGYVCFIIPGLIIWILCIWDANNETHKLNETEK